MPKGRESAILQPPVSSCLPMSLFLWTGTIRIEYGSPRPPNHIRRQFRSLQSPSTSTRGCFWSGRKMSEPPPSDSGPVFPDGRRCLGHRALFTLRSQELAKISISTRLFGLSCTPGSVGNKTPPLSDGAAIESGGPGRRPSSNLSAARRRSASPLLHYFSEAFHSARKYASVSVARSCPRTGKV